MNPPLGALWPRMKTLCREPPVYGANVPPDTYVGDGLRFLRTSDISAGGEVHSLAPVFVDPAAVETRHLLRPGDLLISRSGTLGRAAVYESTFRTATHAGYLVRFRLRVGVDSKFVWYAAQSASFQAQIRRDTIESTIGNFNAQKMGDLRVPCPPFDEQRAIVRFLDEETATIDALIERKQRLRETLRSLLKTRVSFLFENESKANPVTLKRIAPFVTSGSRGWAAHYSDHGANFIRVGNLRDNSIDLDTVDVQKVVAPDGAEARRTLAGAGDVLISITALIGAVGIVPEGLTGYVNQHLALVRPDLNKVDSRWLALCLFSDVGQRQFQSALYGGTKQGLGLDDVRELRLPVPSMSLQRLAVEKADQAMKQTVQASDILREGIRRLQEYRAALITAAVTGQIEIPGVS